VNTTDWIQAISAGVAALVTIVLARITYIYVRETKRIARTSEKQVEMMQKEFEIRLMPLVEERINKTITASPKAAANLVISNKGFYPVHCIDAEIKLSNNENKDEFVVERMDFFLWLEGGKIITRDLSFDFSRLSSFSKDPNISDKATATMTFNYRSINNSELHHLQFVRY